MQAERNGIPNWTRSAYPISRQEIVEREVSTDDYDNEGALCE